jgi:hypothetical protein
MATCKANSGLSVAFWNDHSDLGIMKVKFPQLHSFARRKNCSLNQFLAWDESRSLFLPLSSTAYDQLLQLKVELLALHLQLDKSHEWSYVWDIFSSHRAYKHLQGPSTTLLLFKWM